MTRSRVWGRTRRGRRTRGGGRTGRLPLERGRGSSSTGSRSRGIPPIPRRRVKKTYVACGEGWRRPRRRRSLLPRHRHHHRLDDAQRGHLSCCFRFCLSLALPFPAAPALSVHSAPLLHGGVLPCFRLFRRKFGSRLRFRSGAEDAQFRRRGTRSDKIGASVGLWRDLRRGFHTYLRQLQSRARRVGVWRRSDRCFRALRLLNHQLSRPRLSIGHLWWRHRRHVAGRARGR